MLIIRAVQGQKININKDTLTLDLVDNEFGLVDISITKNGKDREYVLQLNEPVQIYDDVIITLTHVMQGREAVATLGFDAPLSVKIKGQWVTERPTTAGPRANRGA